MNGQFTALGAVGGQLLEDAPTESYGVMRCRCGIQPQQLQPKALKGDR